MYLGIDYGKKRIGLAVGSVIPRSAGVIENTGYKNVIIKLSKLVEIHAIDKIILGLPIRSSGDEGQLAVEIRELAKMIVSDLKIPVEYEEEQYTSTEAERILIENKSQKGLKDITTDELAAILILEQYLKNK